ncbi:MAG: hypothetical protein ACE5HP_13265 [Gemmatimonadota bacterium]
MRLRSIGTAWATLLLTAGAALGQGGTIRGTVSLAGAAPEDAVLRVTKDQAVCGETVPANRLLVKDGRVRFAVVHLAGLEGTVTPDRITLMNRQCGFDPPVLAAAVGSTIEIGNADPVLHNTHLRHGRRTVANLALSHEGDMIENTRALRRAGLVEAECDAHEWMSAKIWVFDNPYFAVTDEAGSFEIPDVPPGTYALKVWHELLGELEQEVTVAADGTSSVEFSYSAERVASAKEGEE